MGWTPEREQSYLSFNEQIVISAHLHPITAVLPFVRILVVAVALLIAFSGALGLWAIPFGVFGVVWLRSQGYAGSLGFIPVALLVALLWAGYQYALEPATRNFFVALVVVVVGIKGVVDHMFTRLYLTDRRFLLRSGIFTERRSTLPLRALTDMRYDQTIPGRIFDYGHFFVESAGQNQAISELRFVDGPVRFYRIAMELALGGTLPPEELIQP